jgi:CheY-like chemotaxis protein
MSGREVCTVLKGNPRTRHIPIIISSASMQTNDPHFAQGLGADGLLIKPFHAQDLLNLVYSFLDPA